MQHLHSAPGALAMTLALVLGLSACGKEGSSGAAGTPAGAAPAAPAAGASSPASPASGVTTNGGLPASQLGSIATPGGSKNSSPNNSTGNAAR
jgi:hypothetical protein